MYIRALATFQMQEDESITAYLTCTEVIIGHLRQYDLYNGSDHYVVTAMAGLTDRYAIFTSILEGAPELPQWDDFKSRIKSFDQLGSITRKNNQQIMAVNNESFPNITKSKKQNHSKFTKRKVKCGQCYSPKHNSSQCDSNKYCNDCNNRSHDTNDCR